MSDTFNDRTHCKMVKLPQHRAPVGASVEKGDLWPDIYRNKRVLVKKCVFISKLCEMSLLFLVS